MSEIIQLKELKSGQRAVISELAAFDDMRRRLQDIGLIEGTVVECVGKSPLGDPAAYLIRGAVIALRSEDSGQVLVYQLEPEDEKAKTACWFERTGEASCQELHEMEEEIWG